MQRFFVLVVEILLFCSASCLIASPMQPNNLTASSVTAVTANPSPDYKTIKLRWGTTLDALLRKNQVPKAEISGLISSFRSVYDPRRMKAGEALRLAFTDSGNVAALLYKPAPELEVHITRDSIGGFVAELKQLPISMREELVVGEISSTLYEALLDAGESPELIIAFSDIFQWDIDFFIDPRVGDRFAILFEKHFLTDGENRETFVRYGKILAAAYSQADTTLTAFGYNGESNRMRYYDDQGRNFQKTFLKSPLNYRRISSYFSKGRFHPILKRVRAHTGVDFAASRGTPVVAAADGVVVMRGWNGGYGNCVKIAHKNGQFVTLYGHLSRFARKLRKGDRVKQNQVIGFVGSTGLSSGPHLHYTMYQHGRAINPLKIRPLAGKPIAASERDAFFASRNSLQIRLGLIAGSNELAARFPERSMAR